MSKKPLTIKSPEFKALAKQKIKFWLELDNSRVPHPGIDHIQDQWGTYVPMDKVKKLLDVMDQLVEVDDKDQSRAIRYSRAALLLSLNQLDEAEKEFKLLVSENPEQPGRYRELVLIAARRGDLQEASQIATHLNRYEYKAYHLSQEQILEEFERHSRLTKPSQS